MLTPWDNFRQVYYVLNLLEVILTQNSWGIQFQEKKSSPKQWIFENHNFTVWNSENVEFNFTEKFLMLLKSLKEKHII